jgi:hypothetical protein
MSDAVDAAHGIERGHRPVAAKDHALPPASEMLFHMPPLAVRSGPRFRPHTPSTNPGGAGGAIGREETAARMHGGYYAELAEARHIGQIDGLDVLHAIAAPRARA